MAWPPGPWEHLPGYVPQTSAAPPTVATAPAPGLLAPLPAVEELPAPPRRLEQVGHIAREVAETLILTFAIFFLIRIPFQNFRIEGFSMEPTLHTGQYIIVNRALYRWFSPPARGDIIVLRPPNNLDRDYIKRIVGLPGETVEVRQGKVFINGQPLEEKYIQRPGSYTKPATTLGPKEYFVLGDNRDNSNDSHTWGPLPEDLIEGKAWVTYWPPQDWGMVPNFSFASGP